MTGQGGTGRMIHPGPRPDERVQHVAATLVPVSGVLPAGQSVMDGIAALMQGAGCRGGMIRLDGVVCDPMRYVLPALSSDGIHAAWYSDSIAPDGPVTILRATASVGIKDGAPFLHCHGVWTAADGTPRMGHLLPFDSVVSTDAKVKGIASPDAWFESLPDAETAFTLFQPAGGATTGGAIARVRPGQDVVTAIEALAARYGITDAALHGLGSIDHIRFQDGSRVDCMATELHLLGARLTGGRAHIPIEVVDIDAAIHSGTLTRGNNPVGVTMEILIEPQKVNRHV